MFFCEKRKRNKAFLVVKGLCYITGNGALQQLRPSNVGFIRMPLDCTVRNVSDYIPEFFFYKYFKTLLNIAETNAELLAVL